MNDEQMEALLMDLPDRPKSKEDLLKTVEILFAIIELCDSGPGPEFDTRAVNGNEIEEINLMSDDDR